MNAATRDLIEQYWQTMNTNDFRAVGDLLHDDFVLDYPQSGERLRGRERNALFNETYPSPGPWSFHVERLLVGDDTAVTDVVVRGAEVEARAISFFEIRDDRIWRITEYWPDPFEAPEWRAHLVEAIPG
jgi:ketosteroid isomerase-like protein